jgi:succinylglutamate desuccinylase
MDRVLGSISGRVGGPTFVGLGGIHGNEPAGVRALTRVLEELGTDGELSRGTFLAVRGNGPALHKGVRFIDRDLNRIWVDGTGPSDTEAAERDDLARVLESAEGIGPGPRYLLDLHTTSASAPPFAVLGDRSDNRAFGRALPVPLVLGLTSELEGTLLEYLDQRGWITVGFESGEHAGARSIELSIAAVWLLLGSKGLLEPTDPRVVAARQDLQQAAAGCPEAVEVFHRHPVDPGGTFRMLPGFRSFQVIQEGELLAREGGRDVRAPASGTMLMPLYQPTGEDGFFLTQRVSPDTILADAPA